MLYTADKHWLDRYASGYHAWKDVTLGDGEIRCFIRPLGLVELGFDNGSRNFNGRADLTTILTINMRNNLSVEDFRERVLLAWTCMNAKHSLLRANVADSAEWKFDLDLARKRRCFIVSVPPSKEALIEESAGSLFFLEDEYVSVHKLTFLEHSMNVGQQFDHSERLSRMIVFPTETHPSGEQSCNIMLVGAHQIEDGLTAYAWTKSLLHILNLPLEQLHSAIDSSIRPENIWASLPPAQEDLYPKPSGNLARQRWFWVISRILRHKRKPPPAAFANPLFNDQKALTPRKYPSLFDKALNYEVDLPLNCGVLGMDLSERATSTLRKLCRQAHVTIGAGAFALVALVMMEFEEMLHPDVPFYERRPFVASFPLDARAFCGYTKTPDSIMLSFSDGIAFQFLPSSMPVAGRLKLLAKQAHRQLGIFQKTKFHTATPQMSARSAEQLLPQQYLTSLEYLEATSPDTEKTGVNPQGKYPSNMSYTRATCGVSSIGNRANLVHQGMYDINSKQAKEVGFAADFNDCSSCVRARPGEFLVGAAGKEDGRLGIAASYDATLVDRDLLARWKDRFLNVLEFDISEETGAVRAKL